MRFASHWSVIGPGRRGRVGPGARRPPSDHKPEALVERGGSLQLQFRSAGLAAGLLTLALAPPALAGPNVTVRVEGSTSTVIEKKPVRTADGSFDKGRSSDPAESCSNTSAGGALDVATAGDWDGPWSAGFGSYSVERILGESHPFTGPDYYSMWINNRLAGNGLCKEELQEGDEVLFFVDRCDNPQPPDYLCQNEPVTPLALRAPASASTDQPATVTVLRYDASGNATPIAGARVTGPGVDATTGSGGTANVRFGQAGQITLKASRDGSARSAGETVAVSAPGRPVTPAVTVAPDKSAPVARIRGIREGQRFKRKKAPRTIRGSVSPDPSGLRAVKLSLTRSSGGRCQLYSPSQERFRNSRCGRRVNFRIGDREQFSYLLPKRLGKGRYVLDAIAVDKLGNRDRLARGRNRVVFHVR